MKDFEKDREYYINKRNELINRKKMLVSRIDNEIKKLDSICGHEVMFLVHYEEVKKTKYFIRSYCYLCGRVIFIKKLDNNDYSNIVNVYPIITKFIPKYVDDSFKICVINEVVKSIINNFNPKSSEELVYLCKDINNILLSKIDNINSFKELQSEFINCVNEKKKSLKI